VGRGVRVVEGHGHGKRHLISVMLRLAHIVLDLACLVLVYYLVNLVVLGVRLELGMW